MDDELPLLVMLVSWPMWLSGALAYLGAALLVVAAVLSVLSANIASAIVALILAGVAILVGMLWMFLSRRVRRQARWAYVVAAIVYLLPSAPWLLGMVEIPQNLPQGAALPDWYFTVQTVISVVYLLLGVCAVFLLVISFIPQGETSASTEAG